MSPKKIKIMKTKTINQKVKFNASPRQVYDMIMDSKKHESLSGLRAKISNKVGGAFMAWDKHISGINLALLPGKKIVQAWRATGWWPDHFSVVVFDIRKTKTGSTLHFTQIGIPPNRYSGHYRGWIETYWTPMKEMLEAGELSKKTLNRVNLDKKRISTGRLKRRLSNIR
jgi:activator of HSP90 ATPase